MEPFSSLKGMSSYTRHNYSRLTSAKRKGHRNSQGWYYFSQQGYGRRVTTTMSGWDIRGTIRTAIRRGAFYLTKGVEEKENIIQSLIDYSL